MFLQQIPGTSSTLLIGHMYLGYINLNTYLAGITQHKRPQPYADFHESIESLLQFLVISDLPSSALVVKLSACALSLDLCLQYTAHAAISHWNAKLATLQQSQIWLIDNICTILCFRSKLRCSYSISLSNNSFHSSFFHI